MDSTEPAASPPASPTHPSSPPAAAAESQVLAAAAPTRTASAVRPAPHLFLLAAIVTAICFGAAATTLWALSPPALQPTDPARAAALQADWDHKLAVGVGMLWLPVTLLLSLLFAPAAGRFLPAGTGQPEDGGDSGRGAGRGWRAGWPQLVWRLAMTFWVSGVALACLMLWDRSHPGITPGGWWSVYRRYGALLVLSNAATVLAHFGCERLLHGLRRLRRLSPTAALRPSGLPMAAALTVYALCLSTTFISRPWIAARTPSEAMIDDHLARYLKAIAPALPKSATAAGDADPTFKAEARRKVEITLRSALNAEAVNFTADVNPLILASAIWWYHDDGPSDRRVDLRTGAITYDQWIGSDSRITLPDFCRDAAAARSDGNLPAGASAGAGAQAGNHPPDGGGGQAAPGAAPSGNTDQGNALAGIPIHTGWVGLLTGYGDWHLGPASWGLHLSKEDAFPLAVFFAALAGLGAVLANLLAGRL
ncbi:MAG: hypothetical protein ACREJ2_14575 [Planctomycetota bacterium]